MSLFARFGLFAVLWVSGSLHGQVVGTEFVFKDVPFPSCHASTIEQLSDGLIVAWFGGTAEKNKDVGIWVSRKIDGIWSAPIEVANGVQHSGKRYPCWNPVLFRKPNGVIQLYYKVGPDPESWWGMLMESEDEGGSWSFPFRLPEDILGPVKNKPELLSNGTLICPSSTESDGWRSHVELSSDFGRTWTIVGPIIGAEMEAIQPTILRHGDKLQLLCRSKKVGIVDSWSEDHGKSWTPLSPMGLPNPNSGIDAVTTSSGVHYMVYNPTSTEEGKWGGPRYPLVLGRSVDGKNWEEVATLEEEPGEYSYPAIISGDDGLLHITYTWKRDKIKYVAYQAN